MSDTTKIEWCDMTFNPWIGCTKVSPGCANCYAERDFDLRKHVAKWGPGQPRHRTSEANWKKPLAWDRKAEDIRRESYAANVAVPHRPRVFCGSLCDWLDDEVPAEWLADLFNLWRACSDLDILALTKRPQIWRRRLEAAADIGSDVAESWLDGHAPANVWVGTTVEDQDRADERIPALLKIPARVRFLSCEPLLGPVDLFFGERGTGAVDGGGMIDWVICGGESGPHARPMHPDWARSLRDQCAAAGVPFLHKQNGEWLPGGFYNGLIVPDCMGSRTSLPANSFYFDDPHLGKIWRVGKHAAGRLLDGIEHNQFPEVRHG